MNGRPWTECSARNELRSLQESGPSGAGEGTSPAFRIAKVFGPISLSHSSAHPLCLACLAVAATRARILSLGNVCGSRPLALSQLTAGVQTHIVGNHVKLLPVYWRLIMQGGGGVTSRGRKDLYNDKRYRLISSTRIRTRIAADPENFASRGMRDYTDKPERD